VRKAPGSQEASSGCLREPALTDTCPREELKGLYRQRRERLREALKAARLAGMVVTSRENVHYLTGFTGDESALLIQREADELLTDFRYIEQARSECPDLLIFERRDSLAKSIGKRLRRALLRRVGVESKRLSHYEFEILKSEGGGTHLRGADELIEGMRVVKEDVEIECIRAAARLAESAFLEVCSKIAAGVEEKEIAALLEYEVKKKGAEGVAFPVIVAFGAHSSQPHARPGTRVLREGEIALVDWGASRRFYGSDLTRVIGTGRIPRRVRAIHSLVREALERALGAVRRGASFRSVDRAAREYIEAKGFGRNFGHGVGHGVGLSVHEPPYLGPRARGTIREGMVFTLEPAVYLPGEFGVRIEQMVYVKRGQAELITSLPTGIGELP